MNEMKIFENVQFGQIRTMEQNGEPWFVGKDVAEALGYAKPENAIAAHVDDEDKTTTLIQGTGSNYKSNAVLINESGLYSLVFSSQLETARQFKRWVTSEVLPAIRRTGSYSMQSAFLPSQAVELYAHGKIRLEFQAVEGGGCSLTVERMGAVRGVLGSAKKMNAEEFLATIVEETTDYSYYVVARELYSEYVLWCEKNRYKILNSSNFGKILRQIYPSVAGCRMWSSSVTKETAYRGLKYKNEPNTDAQPSLRR